jgi:hypothetical protein
MAQSSEESPLGVEAASSVIHSWIRTDNPNTTSRKTPATRIACSVVRGGPIGILSNVWESLSAIG